MSMEQGKLVLNGGVRFVLDEPQDSTKELSAVIQKWRRGTLIAPDHQRDFVWDTAKVQAWIDRLADATTKRARKPVGVIVTYQIDDGTPSPVFVNDGSQRIRATIRAIDEAAEFGYTSDTVQQIVDAILIPVQHRWYTSQDEALVDFQLLNMGTSLTPREMCKGILANHPRYRDSWQPMLQEFHDLMKSIGGGLVQAATGDRRQSHKFQRHDFSMIVRWIDRTGLTDYRNVAAGELRKEQIDKKLVVEWDLRKACDSLDASALRSELDTFRGHIKRQVSIYRDVWNRVRPSAGKAMSPTLFRWMLDISIWARQTSVSNADWESFVTALLLHTQGTSIVQDADIKRDRVTLALGSAGKLKSVCRILQSPLYQGKPSRQRSNDILLPGYDSSHVDPFATHGNGPTIPEPASRNRARGAKPIPESTS